MSLSKYIRLGLIERGSLDSTGIGRGLLTLRMPLRGFWFSLFS